MLRSLGLQKGGENAMAVCFKFDIEKAVAATVYVASKKPMEFTQAKLFKMLYFADKDHLVKYCRPITGDWYSAMKDGPVPSHLYAAFRALENGKISESDDAKILARSVRLNSSKYEYARVEAKASLDPVQLSQSDIESLDLIISQYGKMTFSQVRAIAHNTPAYENAWNGKAQTKKSALMKFEDFFEDDANALSGAKEDMLENHALKMTFDRLAAV
jgi:uncharacterized phage-associated protein